MKHYWRVMEINNSGKPSAVYLSSAYESKSDAEIHLGSKRENEPKVSFELLETKEPG
ncbi:MAG TPA: hypothetical protein VG759_06125 [Candidatus Angelobacter sp.]|jgi:hypothetical protein|nr:hypothetical protein [Candidatus Angelobacter sp.]